MKIIFLHGVGQDSRAWDEVIAGLSGYDCQSVDLATDGHLPAFSTLQERVRQVMCESEDEVILVGLSLGAMLGLSLLENPEPNLVGLVSIAGQYQFVKNRAYRFQVGLVKCLPKFIFARQGLDKGNLLDFYQELADLDMTDFLASSRLPVLLLCGEKDKVNLKTAHELNHLLSESDLRVIARAGHEVNREQPLLLAEQIKLFCSTISQKSENQHLFRQNML